jgi:hypothetical protein
LYPGGGDGEGEGAQEGPAAAAEEQGRVPATSRRTSRTGCVLGSEFLFFSAFFAPKSGGFDTKYFCCDKIFLRTAVKIAENSNCVFKLKHLK